MKPYLFGEHNDQHIIDLEQTTRCMQQALDVIRWARGGCQGGVAKRISMAGGAANGARGGGSAAAWWRKTASFSLSTRGRSLSASCAVAPSPPANTLSRASGSAAR